MKLAFAYDVSFEQLEGSTDYHHETFHYVFWQSRYLTHFSSVLLLCKRKLHASPGSGSRVEGPGVTVHPITCLDKAVHYLTRRRQAKQLVLEALRSIDVVIARLPSEIGTLAIEAAKELGKPCYVELVGHPFHSLWYNGAWYGKLYAPWAHWRAQRLIKKAAFVHYVTEEYLQRSYPTRGRALGCSDVVLPLIPPDQLRHKAEWNAGTSSRSFRIGLIGTLATSYKGISTSLEALQLLQGKMDIMLCILGGGDPLPWVLEAKRLGVSDHVRFDGVIPSGAPVMKWLDQLDLYIQPSLTEGLPRGLLEAMARGIPCIATKVGGIPELLSEDQLIAPKDAKGLAEAIWRAASQPDMRAAMAKRQLRRADTFRLERLTEARQAFLTQFISFAGERSRGWGGD
jgi:glycosyltransferase involved in cell wall biosynthesis